MDIRNPAGIPFSNGNQQLSWDQITQRLMLTNTATGTPAATLPASGFINCYTETTVTNIITFSFSNTSSQSGGIILGHSRGTAAIPTAIQSGDRTGFLVASGYNGTAFFNGGSFQFNASENYVAGTNGGTNFQIQLTPNGSVTRATKFQVNGDGSYIGTPKTVAQLAAAPTVGTRDFVTDSLAPAFGAAVVGGGAVPVPVYYDGAWKVG